MNEKRMGLIVLFAISVLGTLLSTLYLLGTQASWSYAGKYDVSGLSSLGTGVVYVIFIPFFISCVSAAILAYIQLRKLDKNPTSIVRPASRSTLQLYAAGSAASLVIAITLGLFAANEIAVNSGREQSYDPNSISNMLIALSAAGVLISFVLAWMYFKLKHLTDSK